jgi:hypothetical protein
MKSATHCFVTLFVAFVLAPAAFGIGAGPNYDPTKNMLFPGTVKSGALYSSFHNSGEFSLSARAQKKKGQLKRVRDIEMAIPGVEGLSRIAAVGEGSLVKVRSTRARETMNVIPSSDGQSAQVFFRNKKGKVISTKAQVSIGGQFWFETFGAIKGLETQLKGFGAINPSYEGSFAQDVRGGSTGYVQLDDEILFALKLIALAHVKAAVIALGAYGFAVAAKALVFTGASGTAILGLFGGISTIAYGIVSTLQTIDPNAFSGVTEEFISTSREVIGFLEETLDQIINVVRDGGALNWGTVIETLDELIAIPVKSLSEDFQFIVEYSWPPEQRDLDTGTTFLENTVGFSHNVTAPYMEWTGDDTTSGGQEVVTIDLDAAAQEQVLPTSFGISCAAGWYIPAGGSGPATLHMYLFNRRTGTRFGEVTRTITPGAQNGAATTPVGSASFNYTYATRVLRFSID